MNNVIIGNNINVLYVQALHVLATNADKVYPKDHKLHKELINATLVLEDPYSHIVTIPERELSLRYLYGEFAFYMKGSNKLRDINKYSKFWNKISDNGRTVNSGYGYKLFRKKYFGLMGLTQFDHALYHLLKNPDSKRATMLINTPKNTVQETKDTPCTMYLHFCIVDGKLNMTTHMRSNDIFYGTPYDISFFTMLQEIVLIMLKQEKYTALEMGTYSHNVDSLHVYKKDIPVINKVLHGNSANWTKDTCPRMTADTVDQMVDFINVESRRNPEHEVTDNFLLEALTHIGGDYGTA